jgi:endonuclease G, mitochondrial
MKKFLIVLGLMLTGLVQANPIDDVCPQHVVWGAPQVKQEGNNQYLCRNGYAVNYNYATKVAYFVTEVIRPENLVRSAQRKDDFRERFQHNIV